MASVLEKTKKTRHRVFLEVQTTLTLLYLDIQEVRGVFGIAMSLEWTAHDRCCVLIKAQFVGRKENLQ